MIPHEQNLTDLNAARDKIRTQLTKSYQEYHARRRRVRTALTAIGSALMVVLGAAGWYRMSSQTSVSNQEPIASHLQEAAHANRERPSLVEDRDEPNALNPARYQHMQLKVLSEEELPAALVQSSSDWFLVTINGEPQAFSRSAMESQPQYRTRRRIRN